MKSFVYRCGILLLLVCGTYWVFLRVQNKQQPVPPAQQARSSQEIFDAWHEGVAEALRTYERTKDATQAKTALLALSVPKDKRDIHLALVLALEGLSRTKKDALKQYETAKALFMK